MTYLTELDIIKIERRTKQIKKELKTLDDFLGKKEVNVLAYIGQRREYWHSRDKSFDVEVLYNDIQQLRDHLDEFDHKLNSINLHKAQNEKE